MSTRPRRTPTAAADHRSHSIAHPSPSSPVAGPHPKLSADYLTQFYASMLPDGEESANAHQARIVVGGGELTVMVRGNRPEVRFLPTGKGSHLAVHRLKLLSVRRHQLPPLPDGGLLEWTRTSKGPSVRALYPGRVGERKSQIAPAARSWAWATLAYFQEHLTGPSPSPTASPAPESVLPQDVAVHAPAMSPAPAPEPALANSDREKFLTAMLQGHTGKANADHVRMHIAGGELVVRVRGNRPEVEFRVGRKSRAADLATSRLKRLSAHRSQLPPLPDGGSLEWLNFSGPPILRALYPGASGEPEYAIIPGAAWSWTRAVLTYFQYWIISPGAPDRLIAPAQASPAPALRMAREQAPAEVAIPDQSSHDAAPHAETLADGSAAPADVTVAQPRTAPETRASRAAAGNYRRLVEELDGMGSAVVRRSATVNRPQRSLRARTAVLARSEGRCENPQCFAPDFHALTDVGDPVLEVDHVHDLAIGGADHPANMVALCPNCHAIKTRGRDREQLRGVLADVARERHAAAWSCHQR